MASRGPHARTSVGFFVDSFRAGDRIFEAPAAYGRSALPMHPEDGGWLVNDEQESLRDEILFLQVVSMFQIAAMQQMGKIPNPLTNDIERDLDQAKISVDILATLKKKTRGNLSAREDEYLGKALFESQMNYLDELKRPVEESGGGKAEGSTEEPPKDRESPAPGGKASERGPSGEGDG